MLSGVAAQWMSADAWVFAAIDGSGPEDGSSLRQVVARADAINHAILTEAEFVRAVGRLVAAGLVGADSTVDRYWQTESGRTLYAARMKGRGLFGWTDALPPALYRLGPPRDVEWSLPVGAFERAVNDYLGHAGQSRPPRPRPPRPPRSPRPR